MGRGIGFISRRDAESAEGIGEVRLRTRNSGAAIVESGVVEVRTG